MLFWSFHQFAHGKGWWYIAAILLFVFWFHFAMAGPFVLVGVLV
jgi:hypothetical protein